MRTELIAEIRNSLSNIWQFNREGKTENLQNEIAYVRRLMREEELKNEEETSFPYLKCEEKHQIEKMKKLGINTDTMFEQCVNGVILLAEKFTPKDLIQPDWESLRDKGLDNKLEKW